MRISRSEFITPQTNLLLTHSNTSPIQQIVIKIEPVVEADGILNGLSRKSVAFGCQFLRIHGTIVTWSEQTTQYFKQMKPSVDLEEISKVDKASAPKIIALIVLAIYLVFLSIFVLSNPIYTWDLVPYVATSFSYSINDPTLLHQATYELLSNTLEEANFNTLIAGPYASDMYTNAENFISQLNMYHVKPLYVFLISSLGMLGINTVTAIFLLSLLPALLILMLLFHWLSKFINPYLCLFIVISFSIAARLPDISRAPIPDNLSTLFIMFSVFLILEKPFLKTGLLILAFSILVRTNNIIFITLFLLYLLWQEFSKGHNSDRNKLNALGTALCASVLLYFFVSYAFNHDWWRLFYHTFVSSISNINDFDIAFSASTYLGVLSTAFSQLVASGTLLFTFLPVFFLMSLLALSARNHEWDSLRAIIFISYLNFAAYFVLFPLVSGWDRFFTPMYAFITVYTAFNLAASKSAASDT